MKSKNMMEWKKEFKRIMGARPTECLVSYWQTWPTGDTCWLLIDYCCAAAAAADYCWQTIAAAADYFHLRQSPPFQLSYCWLTPTRDCIKSQYFLEISISESFPKRNLASKYYLVKVTFFFIWWLKNIGLVLSSSCIWGGKYFSFWHFWQHKLWLLIIEIFDFFLWLPYIAFDTALALFLYFCISSAASGYLRVFVSGIFPCRPVLLTLGLGHSVGLDESLRALAQIPACTIQNNWKSALLYLDTFFLSFYFDSIDPNTMKTTYNTVQAILTVFVSLMYLCDFVFVIGMKMGTKFIPQNDIYQGQKQ